MRSFDRAILQTPDSMTDDMRSVTTLPAPSSIVFAEDQDVDFDFDLDLDDDDDEEEEEDEDEDEDDDDDDDDDDAFEAADDDEE